MDRNKINVIIKEYFNMIAPLMVYEPSEQTDAVERKIIEQLCEVKGANELSEECYDAIVEARCIQTVTDGALMMSVEKTPMSAVYDLKTSVLSASNVNKLKTFDTNIFVDELKRSVNVGSINACKLMAILSWMGILVPKNKEMSKNIWTALAINGDMESVDMLIYCHSLLGEEAEKTKWEHIRCILKTEEENFSAVASYSCYESYSEEEVQCANLIMCITQYNATRDSNEGAYINRPMTHYVLHSKDDYVGKMDTISSNVNYYLVLHAEEKHRDKKYGF